MSKGMLFGIGAYVLWGLLPLYWQLLDQVPAAEILVHRVLWSLVLLVVILLQQRRWQWLRSLADNPTGILRLAIAALLLSVNWFVYIWGVNNGFVVETSLGYFITPLLSVSLGVMLLGERLRLKQWLAVGLAGTGVLYLTFGYGSLPWIALTLSVTFGLYGLLKKTTPLASVESLSAEMAFMFIPALAYMTWLQSQGYASFGHESLATSLLLIGTGIVTATPLLLFAAAAHSIPLSTIGVLQYIAPTMQFLLGIFFFHEPFNQQRLLGFAFVWLALLIFTLDNLQQRWRKSTPAPSVRL